MPPRKPRPTRRGFGRLRQFRSGRWKASYTGSDGKLYEAPHTFQTKLDGEAWLADRRRELDRDLWSPPPTAEKRRTAEQRKRDAVTLKDYSTEWLDNRTVKGKPLRPRTRAHYTTMLDQHILPTFGETPVRDITVDNVDAWYAKLLVDKPVLRAHTYSLLRTILETALKKHRLITSSPCMIEGGGTAQRTVKPEPATVEELAIIADHMPDRYRLMVPLAAWCALRFGELVALDRRSIAGGVVRVRRGAVRVAGGWQVGDPKSDAGIRDIAIPPHLHDEVQHHLDTYVAAAPDSLLFPPKNGEGHLQPSTLYRWFYKGRAAAKRPDLRWHDLRHTGATFAAIAGATTADLMQRIGHSTPAASARYQHAAQGRDKTIAEALSKLAQPNT